MADVQVNQSSPGDGRGSSGVIWGVAAGLLVVILVLVFLIFARDDGGRRETEVDVDVPQPSTIEVPRVEVPEVRVPDKIEVDVPDKVEVEVKTPPPQKTTTN